MKLSYIINKTKVSQSQLLSENHYSVFSTLVSNIVEKLKETLTDCSLHKDEDLEIEVTIPQDFKIQNTQYKVISGCCENQKKIIQDKLDQI